MRRRRRSPSRAIGFVLIVLVVAGAALVLARQELFQQNGPFKLAVEQSAPTLPPTPMPPVPDQFAQRYFAAWERADYDSMYDLLSAQAKTGISKERFLARYRAINSGAAILSILVAPEPSRSGASGTQSPTQSKSGSSPGQAPVPAASIPYKVTVRSARFGDITEENLLPLVREGDEWRVDWTPGLIFKGLTEQNVVRVTPDDPVRGSILDRNGKPLATQGQVLTVGVIPKFIENEKQVLSALGDYLGMKPEDVKARYANAQPDWWVPLRDLSLDKRPEATAKLGKIPGIALKEKEARVYPYSTMAAHVVGYVSKLNADDLKKLAPKGYEEGDYVGRTGIEAWADETLAGKKGGKLAVFSPEGTLVRTIAERPAKPGGDVQLTIDLDAQQQAEKSLGDKSGSIVLIDPRDNSIVAMVSHPAFDPNGFILGFSSEDWKKLTDDPRHPFQNRASLSAYPTGSIFKVITMAAGMERGGYRPDTPFDCTGTWTGLGEGIVLRDWLPQGHGRLDLTEGLVTSCNIVFYEIGKKLDGIDPTILPSFARQFGLGEATEMVGLEESEGTVPDPQWKRAQLGQAWYAGDSVNLAIGQGFLQATPLQMANLYAALANGGTLRTPVLVKRLGNGPEAKELTTQDRHKLPVSTGNLAAIRQAMKRVASSTTGTANYAFRGFRIPTAAKTGSAENQNPDAHAWFAGYAPADAPEVAIIVMVEGGKAGGEVAAPLGRQVLEGYFAGR